MNPLVGCGVGEGVGGSWGTGGGSCITGVGCEIRGGVLG